MSNEERRASDTWDRVRTTVQSEFGFVPKFPHGASAQTLKDAEGVLGKALPTLVHAVYGIHDGLGVPAVVDRCAEPTNLISIADCLSEWSDMNAILRDLGGPDDFEPPPDQLRVERCWWSSSWLPIATSGTGDLVCVDLHPPDPKHFGQIIDFDHESSERNVIADNICDYLNEIDVAESDEKWWRP